MKFQYECNIYKKNVAIFKIVMIASIKIHLSTYVKLQLLK